MRGRGRWFTVKLPTTNLKLQPPFPCCARSIPLDGPLAAAAHVHSILNITLTNVKGEAMVSVSGRGNRMRASIPSPSTLGEGRVRAFRNLRWLGHPQNPHPSPLPEYRARERDHMRLPWFSGSGIACNLRSPKPRRREARDARTRRVEQHDLRGPSSRSSRLRGSAG
jgi:hypothetical protein